MTAIERNHCKSDIDDRTERETCARGREAAKNEGNISPRWVDVMPQVEAAGLLDSVRAARAVAVQRGCVDPETEITAQVLARRARERRRYARDAEQLRQGKTVEQIAAERQAARIARMTPKQRADHEYYMANREHVLELAKKRKEGGR